MPCYIYRHPEKRDLYIEIVQGMNDTHEFVDNDGLTWQRVFTTPNFAVNSLPIDPYSKKAFLKATEKKGTIGNMWDLSAELSEKREELDGEDPIKKEYFEKYKKENKVKHLADRPKVVETDRYKIDYTKKDNLKFENNDK